MEAAQAVRPQYRAHWVAAGLVTNLILFCSLFTIKDRCKIQCPLGFATLGKAAALALATSRALTDLRQYINSDLGFSDLKMCFLYSK